MVVEDNADMVEDMVEDNADNENPHSKYMGSKEWKQCKKCKVYFIDFYGSCPHCTQKAYKDDMIKYGRQIDEFNSIQSR